MVAALTAVALGLFFIGIVLCGLGYAAVKSIAVIWGDLGPLLEHEMLMRRIEGRLMLDDSGFECPKWLNDDDDEDEEGKEVRLVPKPDKE